MRESRPGTDTAATAGPGGHGVIGQFVSASAPAAGASRTWSRPFRASAGQVREARAFLKDVLGDRPFAGEALVCLSELATNSVQHSNSRRPGGYFAVHITLHPGVLRVEVEDEGGPWRYQPGWDDQPGRGDQHGRGLVIVDGLSSDWAVSGNGTGARTVWFEIRHP